MAKFAVHRSTQIEQEYSQPMNSRDLIRQFVLKTNSYRPFSSLNKFPYELAVKAFRYLCGQFPAITSVYLRGSLAEREWVPALSDIDLTIVIDDALRLDEEYAFLHSFWKAHKRLKRLFPMLGEIEIFNVSELRIVRKFGTLGYKSDTWQRIYGKEVRNFEDVRPDLTTRYVDPINYALQFYLEPFLRGIAKANVKSYLATADLGRLASKIIRILDLIEPRSDIEHIRRQVWDDGTLLEFVMFVEQQELASFIAVRIGSFHLRAPKNKDLRLWIGPRDLCSLMRRCVEVKAKGFHIVYGVSAQPMTPYDLSYTTRLLSWKPEQTT